MTEGYRKRVVVTVTAPLPYQFMIAAFLSSAAACFDFDYLMLEFWLSELWLLLSLAELLALLLPVSAGTIWLSLLG
jgi:hypothetical protein